MSLSLFKNNNFWLVNKDDSFCIKFTLRLPTPQKEVSLFLEVGYNQVPKRWWTMQRKDRLEQSKLYDMIWFTFGRLNWTRMQELKPCCIDRNLQQMEEN